jgi:hypothetical protein
MIKKSPLRSPLKTSPYSNRRLSAVRDGTELLHAVGPPFTCGCGTIQQLFSPCASVGTRIRVLEAQARNETDPRPRRDAPPLPRDGLVTDSACTYIIRVHEWIGTAKDAVGSGFAGAKPSFLLQKPAPVRHRQLSIASYLSALRIRPNFLAQICSGQSLCEPVV